jgi:seryl-tRNA synthetase
MHDRKMVREQLDGLREAMRRRRALDALGPVLDRADALERERRALIADVEERKAQRNANTQEVARRKRAGESAEDLIAHGRTLGDAISAADARLGAVEAELDRILLEIPNVTLPDVPEGGEECNAVVRSWGAPRVGDGLRPHWDIGPRLGVFDLERAAKVSGSGFVFYRRGGARLVRALMNFFVDTHAGDTGTRRCGRPRS